MTRSPRSSTGITVWCCVGLKILRDAGEAEDVMQAVFMEIYKVAGQFDPARGTTKAWLLQYAYHRSMNRRQYLKARNFYDQGQGAPCESDQAEKLSERQEQDSWRSPRFAVLSARVSRVSIVLKGGRLRWHISRACRSRRLQAETGESFGNVRHHYYRGLSHLRSFLLKGNGGAKGKRNSKVVHRGFIDVKA